MRPLNKRGKKSGFTLVEMIVSMTILSLLLLTLAKAISYVSQIWVTGVGTIDNYSNARNILSVMDRDIQKMVMRPDMAAFVNGDSAAACAFYTNVEGIGTDGRTVSLVQYLLNPTGGSSVAAMTTLGRLNSGMNYSTATPLLGTPAAPLPAALTQLPPPKTSNTDTVATGVIQFEWQFIDGAGNILTPASPGNYNFSYDYNVPGATTNPRAVIVSIVVLSNSAYQLAAQQPNILTTLQSDFSNTLPANSTQTYSQYWDNTLNPSTGTLDPRLPPPVRSGLEVFQRYIPLPVGAP